MKNKAHSLHWLTVTVIHSNSNLALTPAWKEQIQPHAASVYVSVLSVCVCPWADIWQGWTCSYTGCECPEGSRPTREWARQLARASASVSAVIGSLAMWLRHSFLCPDTENHKKDGHLNPICFKRRHFNMCLQDFVCWTPSVAECFIPSATVNAGNVPWCWEFSVWCVAPIWSEKSLHS